MQSDRRFSDIFISNRRGVALAATLILSVIVATLAGLLIALLSGVYAVGLVLGLIALVLILRDIELGFAALMAVIALLPFAAVPLNIGFKPTFLDLVVVALFGVWLLERATGKIGRFVSTPLTLPVLVFLALTLASFIAGLGNAPLNQTIARHFAEIVLSILLFFLVTDSVRDEDRLRRVTRFVIVGGILASAIAIILYLLPDQTSMDLLSRLKVFGYPEGPGVLRYIRDDPLLPQRATGTSVDPNALGGLLIMMLTLTTPQLFAPRPLLKRRWIVIGLGLIGLALLLSFSRGSFVGAGVALLVLGVVRYRKLLLIMALALGLILILPQTQSYVTNFFEGVQVLQDVQAADLSTQMRVGEYSDALKLIQRYPVFGVGFTGSPDIDTYLKVASLYLTIAGEMGLVGLMAFLIVMGALFVSAWRARPSTSLRSAQDALRAIHDRSDVEPIWWGFHAALVGALIGGIFDHYFFNLDFHHSVTLFWLYVGLAAVSTRLLRRDMSRRSAVQCSDRPVNRNSTQNRACQ
jgi:polysaccharide biosynthesis protein PslJ